MPLLTGENLYMIESLEKDSDLPFGLLQGVSEVKTGYRPQKNILPPYLLPPEQQGDNETEQDVIAQNFVAAKLLSDGIKTFGDAGLATHAFLHGVENVENGINNGFNKKEVSKTADVLRRQAAISGQEFDKKAFKNTFGIIPSIANKPVKTNRPAPLKPVSLKQVKGRYFTGNMLDDAIIWIESQGKANAYNNGSGASGLFQYLKPAAKEDGVIRNGKDMRQDPYASFLGYKKYKQKTAKNLAKHGIPVTPTSIYLSHQQGRAGFVNLWKMANGQKLSPKQEAGVRTRMDSNGGAGKTPAQFLAMWGNKIKDAAVNASKFTGFTYNELDGDIAADALQYSDQSPAVQQAQVQDSNVNQDYQFQQAQQPVETDQQTEIAQAQQEAPSDDEFQVSEPLANETNNDVNLLTGNDVIDTNEFEPEEIKTVEIKDSDYRDLARLVFGGKSEDKGTPAFIENAIKGALKGA